MSEKEFNDCADCVNDSHFKPRDDDDRKTASTHEVSDFPSCWSDSAWEWS